MKLIIHYVRRKITSLLRFPCVNSASMSCGKHKPIVENCIAVIVKDVGLGLCKNCPSRIFAAKEGNSDVKNSNKREIFVPPSSCGNLANIYLVKYNSTKVVVVYIWNVGGFKRHRERNFTASVDVDKFPFASRKASVNHGNPISIGTYPLLTRTVWHHSVAGEPVERRELAIPCYLRRVRMKNTWEPKRERNR
jgi:hypothetical protein